MMLLARIADAVGLSRLRRRLLRGRAAAALRGRIAAARPLKVVLGDGGILLDGWIGTDRGSLDIALSGDWRSLFAPGSIDRLLSEHVFEHLTLDECGIALRESFRHLKPGGKLRIAVPDGNRQDEPYASYVRPPATGHKILFDVDMLCEMLTEAGFEATPLEYFDRGGTFHCHPWDDEDGLVRRSSRYDRRVEFQCGPVFYTSLIVDACKR